MSKINDEIKTLLAWLAIMLFIVSYFMDRI